MSKIVNVRIISVIVKYRIFNKIGVDILFEDAGEQHLTDEEVTLDEMLHLAGMIGCSCPFEKFTVYHLRSVGNPLFTPAPTAQINSTSKQSE